MELITWQELQVGQLLCVENNEELPADIVILATSEEEGRCFIETANLDGETNLKRRVAVAETAKSVGWRALNAPVLEQRDVCQTATKLQGSVEYEQPNNQLYTFTGRLLLNENVSSTTTVPLGPENIMLRGCGVRSCSFVIGLVIFTGSETKLLQNSRAAPSKQSKLYRTANRCMLLIFLSMFVLCLVSAIVAAVWNNSNGGRLWYLPSVQSNDFGDFIVNFFTFLILYNNFVPISLYVSLDIIKVLQANQITADSNLMADGFRAIARTSDLNEELGQVEYIFSDKTGTLTCNLMEFRKCSIGGISYGFGTTEIGRAVAAMQRSAVVSEANSTMSNREKDAAVMVNVNATDDAAATNHISPASPVQHHCAVPMSPSSGAAPESDKLGPSSSAVEHVGDMQAAQVHYDETIHFDDPSLLRHLGADDAQAERIHEFLTLLSICHTVIPEMDHKSGKVAYRASSPDEEALVKAAKCLGYNFVAPAPLTKVEVTHKHPAVSTKTAQFTILNVNEFNSTRKRMSVVAVNAHNEYVLYCKGADNMMLPRALESENDVKMLAHLKNYASEGLRTLVLGRRVLSEQEYAEYNNAYIAASTSLKDREAMLDACAEMIEKDMAILGVTAIEDKLQEGVPGTIFDLAQAGIKIWVLTGDREETAINIGHACRLLDDKMQLLYVNAEDVDTLEKQLDSLFHDSQVQELIKSKRCAQDLAMICDGKALVHIFPSKDMIKKSNVSGNGAVAAARSRELARKLLSVATVCKALIACRVSPSQKAEIVNLVRRGADLLDPNKQAAKRMPQPITLAIGDGANDVSMIQTAHVGVGISGKEGVQAVNASDYAIAQFRFLKRLVLIHGRSNYKRICKVIRYSFYKNIALVVSLFLYNFHNGQSGAPLFESFVMAGWNFFLALPIIVIGIFDRDLPERVVLQYPKLYLPSQCDSDLNIPVFAVTIGNSAVHALIVFWVCWLCYNSTHSVFLMGTIFYSALLMTMKLKVALLTLVWNKYHLMVVIFSVWLYLFFLIVYPRMTFLSWDMYGVPAAMATEELLWNLIVVCPISAILMDFTVLTAQQQFRPHVEDILRERYPASTNQDSEGDGPLSESGKPMLHSAHSLKLTGLVQLRVGGSSHGVLPDKVFITDESVHDEEQRSARVRQHDPENPSTAAPHQSTSQAFDRFQSFQAPNDNSAQPVRRTSSASNLGASRTEFL